ncbi:LANO_0E12266g1_1 [Lachancea nothofagi CBS 11611]|uniref:Small ribosomal subunit protein uS4m n=1 Tax=Lachancea nothofagi CBS 11611 TaxID=1266666 RepID=A0A1G4JY85_9SACH|nr:LANO_0E12266g1_1 [Lachancea nothofagi CBS 11611]
MPRKAVLLKSLARGRIRSSFNKYNLFNLYKKGDVDFRSKTLYQQKWTAKQETRAYHGEHLTESRWQTNFTQKLDSVAQLDASLKGRETQQTPILLQTFGVLEKRLDISLFRAMFASSVRQARQFILHNSVFVNGIKISQPNYTLRPGDVFHVKPEKVLQALGAKKPSLAEALKVDKRQIAIWNRYIKAIKENPREKWAERQDTYRRMDDSHPKKQEWVEFVQNYNKTLNSQMEAEIKSQTKEAILAKVMLAGSSTTEPTAKDFLPHFYEDTPLATKAQECFNQLQMSASVPEDSKTMPLTQLIDHAKTLINLSEERKKAMSDGSKKSLRAAKNLCSELLTAQDDTIRKVYESKKGSEQTLAIPFDTQWAQKFQGHKPIDISELAEDEAKASKAVNLPWQKGVYGREDPSKPYFTPWKPRPFLSPFAILPHHIEVSFKTCHAVYLRDPVARPGQSEVISPFGLPVHERAYMYYVRNGK